MLFAAFKIELQTELNHGIVFALDNPYVLMGLLIGGMMVSLFA